MSANVRLLFIFWMFLISCGHLSKEKPISLNTAHNIPEWFKDGKFGMFIHWGPYSVLGGEWKGKQLKQGENAEWVMHTFQIPVAEYRKVAASFNPTSFNAREWVKLAKKTGMKYIVITAKHHDGFAMYHSYVSDYNIVDFTPFKRDPLKEISEACAEEGIRFCVYYSHREDWEQPYAYGNTWDYDSSQTNMDVMDHPELFRKYLDRKAIPQLKELLTRYGPLGLVWFDRGMYTQEQGMEFANLVHTLQPGCLVNGRVGHYDQELLGDYQNMTDNGMPIGGIEEYWETPQTLNDTWGYSKTDKHWKKPEEIIRRLVAIVSKGGNYLLNVGPTAEGIIPGPSVNILTEVGNWMQKNGESIYETSPSPFPDEMPWGYCTTKGNLLYLHIFDWPENGVLKLDRLKNRIKRSYMLVKPSEELSFTRQDCWLINLPTAPSDPINSVLVVELDGDPVVDPLIIRQQKNEPLMLDYLSATTHGRAVKRFNRKGEAGNFNISKMQGPDDYIEWHVEVTSPGTYRVDITYAAIPGWENTDYIVDSGTEKLRATVKSTRGWYEYKTESMGQFTIKKTGDYVFKIYARQEIDHYLMYFSSMKLVPAL
jgi:alpha-L-fucosidase